MPHRGIGPRCGLELPHISDLDLRSILFGDAVEVRHLPAISPPARVKVNEDRSRGGDEQGVTRHPHQDSDKGRVLGWVGPEPSTEGRDLPSDERRVPDPRHMIQGSGCTNDVGYGVKVADSVGNSEVVRDRDRTGVPAWVHSITRADQSMPVWCQGKMRLRILSTDITAMSPSPITIASMMFFNILIYSSFVFVGLVGRLAPATHLVQACTKWAGWGASHIRHSSHPRCGGRHPLPCGGARHRSWNRCRCHRRCGR